MPKQKSTKQSRKGGAVKGKGKAKGRGKGKGQGKAKGKAKGKVARAKPTPTKKTKEIASMDAHGRKGTLVRESPERLEAFRASIKDAGFSSMQEWFTAAVDEWIA